MYVTCVVFRSLLCVEIQVYLYTCNTPKHTTHVLQVYNTAGHVYDVNWMLSCLTWPCHLLFGCACLDEYSRIELLTKDKTKGVRCTQETRPVNYI